MLCTVEASLSNYTLFFLDESSPHGMSESTTHIQSQIDTLDKDLNIILDNTLKGDAVRMMKTMAEVGY